MSEDASTAAEPITGPLAALSAGALKSVKLKKTKKTKVAEQREKTKHAKQLCETEEDYYDLVKESFFEKYYEKIKDMTFATDYILQSLDEVRALRTSYNAKEGIWLIPDVLDEEKTTELLTLEGDKSSDELIAELAGKVDAMKAKHDWRHAFVRMSIRSPKDAALSSGKFTKIMEKEYASLCEVYGAAPPDWCKLADAAKEVSAATKEERRQTIWTHNLRIIAAYRAQTYSMAIESGEEALELMTRSKRIQGDMHSLLCGTYSDDFQLCVRHFEFFDVCFEFRSFIYKGKMTGLTQYNDLCFFPDLFKYKKEILEKIQVFSEKAIEILEMPNMVLDLVLVDPESHAMYEAGWPALTKERLETLEVKIIEVNPLAEFAGGGLFEWNQDKDVLLGDKPFEFRIQEALSLYAASDLMPEWIPFVYPDGEVDAAATDDAKAGE